MHPLRRAKFSLNRIRRQRIVDVHRVPVPHYTEGTAADAKAIAQSCIKADTKHCKCDTPCPPIESFDNERISICPHCRKPPTPFPADPPKSASRLDERSSHSSRLSQGIPISEYNSDHLYSDDSYEPPQRPVGLGITFRDSKRERRRNSGPHLRSKTANTIASPSASKLWTITNPTSANLARSTPTHPHQLSQQEENPQSPPLQNPPRAIAIRKTNPSTRPPYHTRLHPAPQIHATSQGRPAASTQPTSQPHRPIPQRFAVRSSPVTPGTLSKAALARAGTGGPEIAVFECEYIGWQDGAQQTLVVV